MIFQTIYYTVEDSHGRDGASADVGVQGLARCGESQEGGGVEVGDSGSRRGTSRRSGLVFFVRIFPLHCWAGPGGREGGDGGGALQAWRADQPLHFTPC